MIDPGQIGSGAFRRLDVFMSEPADDCIEALECIPSLTANDWQLIETIWTERSPEWRASCAVVVGHFATPSSRAVLRLALADTNDLVATEAAIAICGQILRHPDFVTVDRGLVQRLRKLKLKD